MKKIFLLLFFVLPLPLLATETKPTATPEATMGFTLLSKAFKNGERIPLPNTCLGADLSPPLYWTNPPPGTQEFALIADDPDAPAGTWVHWVIYKIPAKRHSLPQGVFKGDAMKDVGLQGRSDFGFNGYGGPCPPPGKDHRYYFTLYALGKPLEVKPGLSKAQLLNAMHGLILGEAKLMGLFNRSPETKTK